MSQKGQTEIMGVAIIVIILVIAGVFFLAMRSKNASNSQSFTDPELSQSLLNSIMNTKTERYMIVQDIIKDCYSNHNENCRSDTISDCCDYAHQTLTNALNATLGKWQRSYRLTVIKGSEKKIEDIPENSGCNDFSEEEQPGIVFIPPPPLIIVTLEICKS
jgi:hypothetical protein